MRQTRGAEMTAAQHPEYVLTIVCPDRPGIVYAVASFLVHSSANILESQQYDDRLEERFFMRVHFEVYDDAMTLDRLRARVPGRGRRVADDLADVGRRREVPHAGDGVEGRALPQRPALPAEHRRAAHRDPGRRLEPHEPRAARHVLRDPLPPRSRSRPTASATPRPSCWALVESLGIAPGGARPLHADPVRRDVRGAAGRARSTSTTRSCRASRARGPTSRPTTAA